MSRPNPRLLAGTIGPEMAADEEIPLIDRNVEMNQLGDDDEEETIFDRADHDEDVVFDKKKALKRKTKFNWKHLTKKFKKPKKLATKILGPKKYDAIMDDISSIRVNNESVELNNLGYQHEPTPQTEGQTSFSTPQGQTSMEPEEDEFTLPDRRGFTKTEIQRRSRWGQPRSRFQHIEEGTINTRPQPTETIPKYKPEGRFSNQEVRRRSQWGQPRLRNSHLEDGERTIFSRKRTQPIDHTQQQYIKKLKQLHTAELGGTLGGAAVTGGAIAWGLTGDGAQPKRTSVSRPSSGFTPAGSKRPAEPISPSTTTGFTSSGVNGISERASYWKHRKRKRNNGEFINY